MDKISFVGALGSRLEILKPQCSPRPRVGGIHAHPCFQSQVFRPQSWLWNLKQSWDFVSVPLSHSLGSDLPTEGPTYDQGRDLNMTVQELHLSTSLVTDLTEDPSVDPETDQ